MNHGCSKMRIYIVQVQSTSCTSHSLEEGCDDPQRAGLILRRQRLGYDERLKGDLGYDLEVRIEQIQTVSKST